MKTFLFAWNPNKWNWKYLEDSVLQIEQVGSFSERWSVASHKKIKPGDRIFLMRLGKEPKGIIASGYVSSPAYLSDHWNDDKKLTNYVEINFETIINADIDPILKLDVLKEGNLGKFNWTPQSSGIEIFPEIVDELEEKWFQHLLTNKKQFAKFINTNIDEQKVFTEGSSNQIVITKYERNPYARKLCIEYYGLACFVCNFDFEKTYGEIGKGFIHVHHLNQIADIGTEYKINPINDLRPVCPNCHAMLHKRKIPYTIQELKQKLNFK